MSAYVLKQVPALCDPVTGRLVGFMGADGQEYVFPALDPAWNAFIDASGTPGNATINAPKGKAAFAAGTSSLTITNNYVNANSVVLVQQVTTDGTLNNIVAVNPGNGSFTVTGNANATGTPAVNFFVFN